MRKTIKNVFVGCIAFGILLCGCGKPAIHSSDETTEEIGKAQIPLVTENPTPAPSDTLLPDTTDALAETADLDAETITYERWRDASDRYAIQRIRSTDIWKDFSYTAIDVNENPLFPSEDAPLHKAIIDWNRDWLPHAYPWEACSRYLLPQLWEDDIALQDLCALYLQELYLFKNFVPEMTIESLVEFLKEADHPETEVFRNNLQRLGELAEAQKGRFVPIEGTSAVDLDGDGIDETITLQVNENAVDSIEATLQEYKLFVNGTLVQTFLYESMTAYVLDLDTCKVIYIRPEGRSDISPEAEPERARRSYWCDALFGFANGQACFIGAIDGHYTMYIGEGRFLAAGEFRFEPSHADNRCACYAVKSFAKEYDVPDGTRMYRLSNNWYDSYSYTMKGEVGIVDWQQNNTVWTLCHDLPLYEMDGTTISNQALKAGSTIIIRGISANGYLFVCDEEGNGGIIRLIWPVEEPDNPYAAPGGRRLIYYFSNFDHLVRVG